MPVTLHDTVHLHETPEISGDPVISIVAAQEGVDFADLITDLVMPYLPHKLLQRHKAAPQARFLGAHPNLEVTLLVSRAIQRQTQEVDGFRASSAAFTCVSLREPTKLSQLGLGRLKSKAELSQPKAHVRSILEADHIAHQSGFTPQPALHHALEPEVENVMKAHVAQQHA